MKKLVLATIAALFILTATNATAAEQYPLGKAHAALKIDYITFGDNYMDNSWWSSTDLSGGFIGAEYYQAIQPNLYVGGEIGYSSVDDTGVSWWFGDPMKLEVTYIPIEVNGKYSMEFQKNLVLSFGGGASLNYIDETFKVGNWLSDSTTEWNLGLQIFGNIDYKVQDKLFIGGELKISTIDNLFIFGTGYNTYKLGVRVGTTF
ncbi:MAG: porin family protein [Deltaproteobacteria bacterium]|nr:porin family protein [Deltaproteobacteria bacterium]